MSGEGAKPAVVALAENVLSTRFEDFDRDILENTKKRILDVIGCAIGGGAAPGNRGLIDLVQSWGGHPQATVFGFGIKGPPHEVAWANAILCRSFDWEPLVTIVDSKRYAGHTTGTTVSTALAVGEYRKVSGKELLTALIAGDDVAERVYTATEHPWNKSAANRQATMRGPSFDAWGTMPSFGATAIAGRLLGLSAEQLRHAFGIVINLICGAGGSLREGATTFKLSQGSSARAGIAAAGLARGGWTGIADPLLGKSGYYATFTGGCDYPEKLTRDLGRKYYVEMVFKPYPGGRPTHTTIDAALALARKHDINAEEIEKVIVHLSPAMRYGHYMKPYKVGEYPTGDALFSYKFSTATALLHRSVTAANFTEEAIRDPRVQALIGRTELAEDLDDKPDGIETEVRMKDGRVFREYVERAIGEVPEPLTRDAVINKFMTQVDFSRMVSIRNAERIVSLVDRLEEIEDIGEIISLAAKQD